MSMPVEVRKWIEGAPVARERRDVEQAKADSLQQPIHERAAWLHERKGEANFRHIERMDRAEKHWPAAVLEFEENFCKRLRMEIIATWTMPPRSQHIFDWLTRATVFVSRLASRGDPWMPGRATDRAHRSKRAVFSGEEFLADCPT